VAGTALLLMRIEEPHIPATRAPIFASIGEGLRFVFGHQILLGALALDMFAVLFGGAVALLPAFIKDVLDAGPEALGILRAAPAAGAVIVGLWLARKPPPRTGIPRLRFLGLRSSTFPKKWKTPWCRS
jgi:hypothetical protein